MAFAIPKGLPAALAAAAILFVHGGAQGFPGPAGVSGASRSPAMLAGTCPSDVGPHMYAAYVAGTQEELNVHGYDAGMPDGVVTAKTEAAIRQYQRDAGLPADGCVTKALLDHMKFVLPKVERPRREDAEPIIVEVQTLLTRRGYYLGPVDGIAGRRTEAAAARFAQDAGLATSGAIDRELVEQIKSADPGVRGDRDTAR